MTAVPPGAIVLGEESGQPVNARVISVVLPAPGRPVIAIFIATSFRDLDMGEECDVRLERRGFG